MLQSKLSTNPTQRKSIEKKFTNSLLKTSKNQPKMKRYKQNFKLSKNKFKQYLKLKTTHKISN